MRDKPLILIIEDEEDILELEEFHLQNSGFETVGCLSTKGVREILEEENISLMVVDRNLPSIEGSDFVSEIRERGYDIPVIFVTAKDRDEDVEEGFLKGGDDYLKKPFNMNELILRVKALLKRSGVLDENRILRYKDITIDTSSRIVEVAQEQKSLTKLEFELLRYFIENRARVISRDELIDNIWDSSGEMGYKGVNIAINRLKRKIDRDYITPVRGIGYKLC